MFTQRSRVFTVHINPLQPDAFESAQFVEEGFSYKAFFFTAFWALYHRLWRAFFAIALANYLIHTMFQSGELDLVSRVILELAVNIYVGFQANDWRRNALARKGWVIADIVTGDTLLRAEQRYFDHYYSQRSLAAH
jgi:Protein of unknown function (DUF2628)